MGWIRPVQNGEGNTRQPHFGKAKKAAYHSATRQKRGTSHACCCKKKRAVRPKKRVYHAKRVVRRTVGKDWVPCLGFRERGGMSAAGRQRRVSRDDQKPSRSSGGKTPACIRVEIQRKIKPSKPPTIEHASSKGMVYKKGKKVRSTPRVGCR